MQIHFNAACIGASWPLFPGDYLIIILHTLPMYQFHTDDLSKNCQLSIPGMVIDLQQAMVYFVLSLVDGFAYNFTILFLSLTPICSSTICAILSATLY